MTNLLNKVYNRKILLIFIIIFIWVLYILRNGVALERSQNVTILENQLNSLKEENNFLHLDIAHLKSPDRIQEIATKKLGMVLPDKFFFAED